MSLQALLGMKKMVPRCAEGEAGGVLEGFLCESFSFHSPVRIIASILQQPGQNFIKNSRPPI